MKCWEVGKTELNDFEILNKKWVHSYMKYTPEIVKK